MECAIAADLARLSDGEVQEIAGLVRSRAAFRDPSRPERECDGCGQPYRGPGVYCSFRCAQADAQ